MPTEKISMPQVGDLFTRTEGQGRTVRRHFGKIITLSYDEDVKTGDKTNWDAVIQHGANSFTHLGVGSTFSRDADWQPVPVLDRVQQAGLRALAEETDDAIDAEMDAAREAGRAEGLKDLPAREAAPAPRRSRASAQA